MKHGHAAVAAVALLTTGCSGVFVGPGPTLDRLGLFERVWRDVDRYYSLFSVKGVAWDSLHDTYAPRVAQAASDSELGDVIGAMLLELHDIHVNLAAGPQFYRYSGYDARPAFSTRASSRGTSPTATPPPTHTRRLGTPRPTLATCGSCISRVPASAPTSTRRWRSSRTCVLSSSMSVTTPGVSARTLRPSPAASPIATAPMPSHEFATARGP